MPGGAGSSGGLSPRELAENSIDNEQDPEQRRQKELQYLNDFGGAEGKEFKALIEELLETPGLTVGDVYEINALVHTLYLNLKAQYLMVIFSPDNVGTILTLGLHANISSSLRDTFFKVIPRYLSNAAIGKGYTTFEAFKKAYGVAGTGKNWHHIVSQRSANIAKFGAEKIHNTSNLVKLPSGTGSWHQRITNYYNSIPKNGSTNGLRFGEWVAQKSFQEQLQLGIEIMNLMK